MLARECLFFGYIRIIQVICNTFRPFSLFMTLRLGTMKLRKYQVYLKANLVFKPSETIKSEFAKPKKLMRYF